MNVLTVLEQQRERNAWRESAQENAERFLESAFVPVRDALDELSAQGFLYRLGYMDKEVTLPEIEDGSYYRIPVPVLAGNSGMLRIRTQFVAEAQPVRFVVEGVRLPREARDAVFLTEGNLSQGLVFDEPFEAVRLFLGLLEYFRVRDNTDSNDETD